jgi:hypothetical protein
MSNDIEPQETEPAEFGDELSDEALDRLPTVAASASLNPCGPSPSKPGAVAVPARQT